MGGSRFDPPSHVWGQAGEARQGWNLALDPLIHMLHPHAGPFSEDFGASELVRSHIGRDARESLVTTGRKSWFPAQLLEISCLVGGWGDHNSEGVIYIYIYYIPGSSNGCPIDYPTLLTGLHWAPLRGSWYISSQLF